MSPFIEKNRTYCICGLVWLQCFNPIQGPVPTKVNSFFHLQHPFLSTWTNSSGPDPHAFGGQAGMRSFNIQCNIVFHSVLEATVNIDTLLLHDCVSSPTTCSVDLVSLTSESSKLSFRYPVLLAARNCLVWCWVPRVINACAIHICLTFRFIWTSKRQPTRFSTGAASKLSTEPSSALHSFQTRLTKLLLRLFGLFHWRLLLPLNQKLHNCMLWKTTICQTGKH